jgi:hypothetical protein
VKLTRGVFPAAVAAEISTTASSGQVFAAPPGRSPSPQQLDMNARWAPTITVGPDNHPAPGPCDANEARRLWETPGRHGDAEVG